MAIEIEGVWKDGKIIPLDNIKLEENTKVKISVNKKKPSGSIMSLAGVWKNDDKTYKAFKSVVKERERFTLRK